MAGTRNNIGWWRRVKYIALVLCVQSVLGWLALCGVMLTVSPAWNANIQVRGASVTYSRLPDLVPQQRGAVLGDILLIGTLQWQWPQWLPAWKAQSKFGPGSPLWSWELTLPLWPVPVAFAGIAWYAGRRIKRLRRDVCAKCGYDTRGLAAGAVCPECGAACGGAR